MTGRKNMSTTATFSGDRFHVQLRSSQVDLPSRSEKSVRCGYTGSGESLHSRGLSTSRPGNVVETGVCVLKSGKVCVVNRHATPFSLFLPMLILLIGLVTVGKAAENEVRYLVQLGIKMFPALVGGNLDIASQQNDAGTLLLLVVYQEENRPAAEQVTKRLQGSIRLIHQYPVEITMTDLAGLNRFDNQPVAGIFLAEPLDPSARTTLRQFGIKKKSLLFSPFTGDVQDGILAGLHITTQVKPSLNLTTLRETGLRMNPLFLKVAIRYE
ncbi:MAG: hypothetical protein HQL98_13875 [Magnetococcales bacterium]|nr:hypothetical protein [Magnetococcales bacterium]